MIEPTETETLDTLDNFIEALEDIDRTAREAPEQILAAPTMTLVGRLDETRAIRKPILRWRPASPDAEQG